MQASHRLFIAVVIVFISAIPSVYAHAGGHGKGFLREWHFSSGRHHIHASFHSFRGDTILLENAKGKLVAVPITEFSADDRAYALQHVEYIQSLNVQDIILARLQAGIPERVQEASTLPVSLRLWQYALMAASGILALLLLLLLSAYHRKAWQTMKFASVAAFLLMTGGLYTLHSNAEVRKMILGTNPLTIDSTFSAFKPHVTTRWDNTYFYVENDGMPSSMPAMKGITAWQQQVPLPQAYSGSNAWSIPLNPEYAATPLSTSNALFTGAIALGVNGLPVFNAKNNRGEYSYDIGELDAFGGHCGRADDYHYHIAPLHLQSVVGKTQPVAWALDGFPLYGELEPDGSTMQSVDANLGHEWNGGYHYHAVKTRPYFIAAMKGKVTVQNDQIMPQAQTKGVRPFLQPLNGAVITDLHKCDNNHYALKYTLKGKSNWVNYSWDDKGNYTFNFVDSTGTTRTESYKKK